MKIFHFNPKAGKMNLEKPSEFKDTITCLRERRHVLEIKEYHEKRSNGANAYMWKIVIQYFMSEYGLVDSKSNRQRMHDLLGQELRLVDDDLRPGKKRVKGTSEMDASEFWKYIHKCQLLFQDYFNGSFPPPKSLGYDETKK